MSKRPTTEDLFKQRDASTRHKGKAGIAPCGHPGTHVTTNYVECDRKCGRSDGVPTHVDRETTDRLPIWTCRHLHVMVWNGTSSCRDCGKVLKP